MLYYTILNTNTPTHMFSVYRLLCLPVCFSLDILSIHVYVYINQLITHTHTHTRSLFMSLSRLYMCVVERGGGVPLSRCVSWNSWHQECTHLSHCAQTKRISRDSKRVNLQLQLHEFVNPRTDPIKPIRGKANPIPILPASQICEA
jgi:hypothetical protein